MRQAKVYQNYVRWDDYSLATLAGRTLSFMTSNASFTTPNPDLAAYGAAVNDFREKHEVASRRGSALEIAAKNNARTLLLELMKQMAFYVNTVANGDQQVLASSGFEMMPVPKSVGYPGIVGGLHLMDGRLSGEARFSFNVIRSAWEYEYETAISLDAAGLPEWGNLMRTTTSRINYVSGIEAGTRLYVRVRARNGKGIGDWCEPVSLIVR